MQEEKGYILFVVIASTVVVLLLVFVLADLLLLARNRRLRHRNELLELNTRFEKEILRTRHEATEQAFNDIAVELHDNIGQTLTLSVIHLNQADQGADEKLREHMQEARDIIRQAIQDVRQLSHEISSELWRNFDLVKSLDRIKDRLQRTGTITPDFRIDRDVQLASRDHELIVLRVLQELVNNSLKHARASRISLDIHPEGDNMLVTYEDNGRGYDTLVNSPASGGMGMQLVRQRLELVGAQWTLNSAEGQGFRLKATIPGLT